MTDTQFNSDGTTQVGRIAARAIKLYSRPSVAMEIVRLTEQPQVDARALKECIEQDPALTCKILRVVNSSLFGLTSRVADLNQALSLLGIKPLKLLVLGFSLPDTLFAEVAARELRWYWTGTLTRAVAARMLAEQLWDQPGDEAFIAGLLEDLGMLVMLRELGRPYAKFLSGVIDERCQLRGLERATLGFDHVELSAILLARWQLPQKLIDAISAPRETVHLAERPSPDGDVARVLHLADLLSQLVGQKRMRILPELLDAGKTYCELTTAQLTELVRQLQPQVDQLAGVLSLELEEGRDYERILRDAHEQMGILVEDVVTDGRSSEDGAYTRLRKQTDELTSAVRWFLSADSSRNHDTEMSQPAAQRPDQHSVSYSTDLFRSSASLVRKLAAAATACRQQRHELSLLLFDARPHHELSGQSAQEIGRQLRRAVDHACSPFDNDCVSLLSLADHGAAAVLSSCDRRSALAAAHQAIRELSATSGAAHGITTTVGVTFSAGVATMSVVPKNFEPAKLIEAAERCLNAARLCGISTVKSIEV
jgi:HD-like signal output (HDOD) protein